MQKGTFDYSGEHIIDGEKYINGFHVPKLVDIFFAPRIDENAVKKVMERHNDSRFCVADHLRKHVVAGECKLCRHGVKPFSLKNASMTQLSHVRKHIQKKFIDVNVSGEYWNLNKALRDRYNLLNEWKSNADEIDPAPFLIAKKINIRDAGILRELCFSHGFNLILHNDLYCGRECEVFDIRGIADISVFSAECVGEFENYPACIPDLFDYMWDNAMIHECSLCRKDYMTAPDIHMIYAHLRKCTAIIENKEHIDRKKEFGTAKIKGLRYTKWHPMRNFSGPVTRNIQLYNGVRQ